MKIAYDHQIFMLQQYGGISRYFTSIAQGLGQKGENVKIFAPFHQNRYLSYLPRYIVQGTMLNKYPPKTGRIFVYLNHYICNAKMRGWKPDIVHRTYYSSFTTGNVPFCPTIITVYDMIHEKFADSFSPKDRTTKYKRAALSQADHIISISHSTKYDLMDLFNIPEKKISVIHLGFDIAGRKEVTNADCLKDEEKPYLLYVGTRNSYKNFTGFLQAFAASSDLMRDFDIVAFGNNPFIREELREIESLGIKTEKVRQVSGDDRLLSLFYRKASAFVYPSIYEGFGLPPLEAMAYDCPVICSNTSSMPEVVGEAAEFFTPTDIDEMTNAIKNVVYSDSRQKELIDLGRKRLNLFSWEKCAEETLSVYKRVLS